MEETGVVLVSIKPYYAYKIFRGVKKYELRRRSGASIAPGTLMIVYASGKVRAIIGEFRVGDIIEGSAEEVWRELAKREKTGVGEDAWPYIRGAKKAYAMEVVEPRLYPVQVRLEDIRSIIPGWMPPLSYRVLREGDPLYELVLKPLRKSLGIVDEFTV